MNIQDETEKSAYVEFQLAGVEYDKKDYRKAALHYRRATRILPSKAASWQGLAMSLHNLHQYSNARRAIEEAIRLEPEDSEYQFVLGTILRSQKELGEAAKAFDLALRLGPVDECDVLNYLGVTYEDLKQFPEAYQVLSRALELNPDDTDVLMNIASTESKLGLNDLSTFHYLRAGRLDPTLWGYIAGELRAQRRFQEAADAERNAISESPEDPDNYQDLGNILKDAGLWEEAIEQFKKAVDLNPRQVGSLYQMAQCFAAAGMNAQAKEVLLQALALEPSSAKIQRSLASTTARLEKA